MLVSLQMSLLHTNKASVYKYRLSSLRQGPNLCVCLSVHICSLTSWPHGLRATIVVLLCLMSSERGDPRDAYADRSSIATACVSGGIGGTTEKFACAMLSCRPTLARFWAKTFSERTLRAFSPHRPEVVERCQMGQECGGIFTKLGSHKCAIWAQAVVGRDFRRS